MASHLLSDVIAVSQVKSFNTTQRDNKKQVTLWQFTPLTFIPDYTGGLIMCNTATFANTFKRRLPQQEDGGATISVFIHPE